MADTEHSSAKALDERVPGTRIATSRGRASAGLRARPASGMPADSRSAGAPGRMGAVGHRDSMSAGSRSSDPEAIATQARLAGAIFGAWDGEQFWFPAFQFDDEGIPRPQIGELIAALPRDRDGGIGVDAALWVAAPDLAFEGQSPAECFLRDPGQVIRVARARLRGSEAED